MPRARAAVDVFQAVADPSRRRILLALARGERTVTQIIESITLPQPSVSKHLGVLRAAGLVAVRRRGRERMYAVRGEPLREVRDWADTFKKHWDQHLSRIKSRAERTARRGKEPRDSSLATPGEAPVIPPWPARKGNYL